MGELGIEYAVGIRSNHGVWLPKGQKVRANKWRAFKHRRWDIKEETRYIREIIYGKRRTIQYWQITTDKETVRDESTWFVMTKIPQDAWAQANSMAVESEKSDNQRGYYLHPEVYGQSEERSIDWADNPEAMRRMKEERENLSVVK